MGLALLGLGANQGDRLQTLTETVAALQAHAEISVLKCSRWHQTAPLGGPAGQDLFLNGTILISTSLSPESLLDRLQALETAAGRVRAERWGPRPLDLDLLLYDDLHGQTHRLTLPHPRMIYRRFVLEPACEIAADLVHSATGWTLQQLWDHFRTTRPWIALREATDLTRTQRAAALASALNVRLLTFPAPPDSTDNVLAWQQWTRAVAAHGSALTNGFREPVLSHPAPEDLLNCIPATLREQLADLAKAFLVSLGQPGLLTMLASSASTSTSPENSRFQSTARSPKALAPELHVPWGPVDRRPMELLLAELRAVYAAWNERTSATITIPCAGP